MSTNIDVKVSMIQDYQHLDAAEAAALLRYGVLGSHKEPEDQPVLTKHAPDYWHSGFLIESPSLLSWLSCLLLDSVDPFGANICLTSFETLASEAPDVGSAYPGEPTEAEKQENLKKYGLEGPHAVTYPRLKKIVPYVHNGKALLVCAYMPHWSVGFLLFLIKKQGTGGMSDYIHNLKLGEKLGIMGFLQHPPSMIPWQKDSYDVMTMITGGVGITLLVQILKLSLSDKENRTEFVLIYANKTKVDIIMCDEINRYWEKYNTKLFEVVHVLSEKSDNWGDREGPPGLIKDIAGPRKANNQGDLLVVLKDIGYTKEEVHKL
ncbi:hypothetical protein BT96DRAFT_993414 [Gymnopus androsaceus JB14]|uniref:Oxidoreductase FAD/NAD(P)-binding domain-containing protein n=1 Tax=Gymnopus androsaceus JB14 TaxID=1447944 RepID=A0A6A4HMD2_9AGAR|nr:hypothetical protein BT96DRAFT_993414 [Gymnopus androsaceus JB14]